MSEPRKPSRPKGSGGARRGGTGRSGAGRAKHAGSGAGHEKGSSLGSGAGRNTGGHRGGGRAGSGRFESKGHMDGKGKSDDYRGGKSRSTKSEHGGGGRSGGSKPRSSDAASRSHGGRRDATGAYGARAGGSGRAKGASTGGEWKGRSPGATIGRSTERSRRGSASGSDRAARSNAERGGRPDTGRATDNRSGGAAARRGPRDPLIEEIRAATPKAKQEAAIAAFERARDLLQRGRDGAAADAAADAKRLAPRSGAVRELYGVALYRAGRYRDALRELQAYRRMTGRLDQNHLIADSYRGLGMPDKAVPVAVEAVRSRMRDEPRAEAAIVGASALADLGRFDEALGLLRGFPGRRDEADAWELRVWYVAGDVLVRAGRASEAAEEFRKVIRYDAGAFDAAERLAALTG